MYVATKGEIKAVRQYLMEHGWTQYSYTDAEGGCCIAGAVHRSIAFARQEPVKIFLRDLIPVRPIALAAWNDSESRTFEDVLELLDLAEAVAQ